MENLLLVLILILLSILFILVIIILINIRKLNSEAISSDISVKVAELFEKNDRKIAHEFSINREELLKNFKGLREEINSSFKLFGDGLFKRLSEISNLQKNQLDIFSDRLSKLTSSNEEKIENLQKKVEIHLKELLKNNEEKLDKMREVVDEKLHSTLEKRLSESFKVVSSQLKSVYEGLGEMRKLASGVGDLKNVLTSVKNRGTWGEIQLEILIEQILTPDQYAKNVATKKGSGKRVEFAIKLPGRSDDKNETVWLPVDAKFPIEDYHRLIDAQEVGDVIAVKEALKGIERSIKDSAKDIMTKYIDPPNTTEFAFMFLPVEGLYAEVLRITGLFEFVQREYKITIAGPTNFAAVLNSLQVGFKTLVIEKRSSEVWKLLGTIKTEFGKFGDILEKTQMKLDQASKTIGDASRKSRTIERKLRGVDELPSSAEQNLLEDE